MSNPTLVKWQDHIFAVVGYGYDRSHPPGEFFECVPIESFIKFLRSEDSDTIMISIDEAEEIEDPKTVEMLLVLYG